MGIDISNELLPPERFQIMNYSESRFKAIGKIHLDYFIGKLGIKPDADVLEIGSGNGRIASTLTTYLNDGTYIGVDIMKPFVKWCNSAYRKYPNFNFKHINVFNQKYNRFSFRRAESFRFPFEDNRFDFIYLTSVFTHMLEAEVDNYLSEISRMLKQGGISFITYFLINGVTQKLLDLELPNHKFVRCSKNSYTSNPSVPVSAMAFDETYILSLYKKHKLVIDKDGIIYGKWRDPANMNSVIHNQDRVIARKTGDS